MTRAAMLGTLLAAALAALASGCDGDGDDGGAWLEPSFCHSGVGREAVEQRRLVNTGIATDVAIVGPGFLVLAPERGRELYTRDGQLTLDDRGYLVALDGTRVRLFAVDRGGDAIPGRAEPFPVGLDDPRHGPLFSIRIDVEGRILGTYLLADGEPIGQLALATFERPWALADAGNERLASTACSGGPAMGVAPGDPSLYVVSGALVLPRPSRP